MTKEYYQKNKERIQKKHKIYYENNKLKFKQYAKKYYADPINKKKAVERSYQTRQKKIDWILSHYGTDILHCERCRYNKSFAALEFHHADPKQKENIKDSFSKWIRKYSMDKFQHKILETDCIVLCSNCHAEYHAGLWK